MERFIYIKNGKVLEFAGATSGFRVTDEAQIALYDSGEYILNGNTIEAKVKTLEQLKAEKLQELNSNYQTAHTTTQTVNGKSITITITSDFRNNLQDILRHFEKGTFTEYAFQNDNGSVTVLTKAEFESLDDLLMLYMHGVRTNYATKQGQINNASNETELNNVDITF